MHIGPSAMHLQAPTMYFAAEMHPQPIQIGTDWVSIRKRGDVISRPILPRRKVRTIQKWLKKFGPEKPQQ